MVKKPHTRSSGAERRRWEKRLALSVAALLRKRLGLATETGLCESQPLSDLEVIAELRVRAYPATQGYEPNVTTDHSKK